MKSDFARSASDTRFKAIDVLRERTRVVTLADGRKILNRKARRIGGQDKSQEERFPAMRKFWSKAGPTRDLGWKWQCRCGSTQARQYRRAWWCERCGWEKLVVFPTSSEGSSGRSTDAPDPATT